MSKTKNVSASHAVLPNNNIDNKHIRRCSRIQHNNTCSLAYHKLMHYALVELITISCKKVLVGHQLIEITALTEQKVHTHLRKTLAESITNLNYNVPVGHIAHTSVNNCQYTDLNSVENVESVTPVSITTFQYKRKISTDIGTDTNSITGKKVSKYQSKLASNRYHQAFFVHVSPIKIHSSECLFQAFQPCALYSYVIISRHFWKAHYWISTTIEVTPLQSSLASWKTLISQKVNQHNNYYSSHRARCPKVSGYVPTQPQALFSRLCQTKLNLTPCILGQHSKQHNRSYAEQTFVYKKDVDFSHSGHEHSKVSYLKTPFIHQNRHLTSAIPNRKHGVMPPPTPIEIDEQREQELLYPDESAPSKSPSDLENKINNISSNLSNLDVGLIHATSTGNNKDSMSNSTLVDNRDNDKPKRGRSNNNSLADNRNPAKKLRTVLFANPTMADVVKATSDGHVIDIRSAEGAPDMTTDQSDILQEKLSEALFANDDIEQLNFDDPPCFDGTKLICSNSFTKNWVEKTVPELQGLWDNAELSVSVVGPPPTLFKASFQMPHPTFLPPALFSIITAQNATIDTKFWKYGFRTKVDKGMQTWYIGVDEESAKALKNIGFRPHVGLGTIKMSVTNKPFEQ